MADLKEALSANDLVDIMRGFDETINNTGQIEQMLIDLRYKEVIPAIEDAKKVSEQVDNLVKESKVNKQSISNISQAIDEAKASSNTAIARAQELLKDITTINDKWDDTDKRLAEQIDSLSGLTDGLDKTKAELAKLSSQAQETGKTVVSLSQSSDGLKQAVADVKGNVTSLQQLSDMLKRQLSAQDGRLTDVETKAGEMTTTLSKQQTAIDDQGKLIDGQGQLINQVKQTADEATQTLVDQGKAISEVQSTASQLRVDLQTANGDINDLKMTSQGLSNQVGNMVSKADLADATKKITDLSTLVDQTKSAVDIKANQTDVDRLKQSVSDANAQIGIQANQITNLVTKSDLTTATNGMATQDWVQTQVAQQANQWNLNITDLQTKTNESLAGAGVNLTTNTSDQWKTTAGNSSMIEYFSPFPVNPGETYTFSVEYRNFKQGSATNWGMQIWAGTETARKAPFIASKYSGSSSGKITLTVTVPANEHYLAPNLNFSNGSQTGGSVDWRCFKSERGSIATPWTPAPSDMATVKSVVDITAALDGVRQTAQSKADKSETTQLANAMKTLVTNDQLTTAIRQTADTWNASLTDKTKGDALIAQINQTAGKTLIQNGKIVLSGDTIVDGGFSANLINAGKINTDSVSIGNSAAQLRLTDQELVIENSNQKSAIRYGNGYIRTEDANGNTRHKILMQSFVNDAKKQEDMLAIATADRLATNKKPQFKVAASGVFIAPSLFFEGGNNGDNWLGFSRSGTDTVYFRTYDDTKQLFEVWCQAGFKQDVHIKGNTINGWQFWSDASHDMIAFGSRKTSNFTTVQAKSFAQMSTLSSKTNILPIEEDEAIEKIKAVDMRSYQYISDVEQGKSKRYASLIIDDVNEVSQYGAPKEFLSETGTAREDGSLVAYLTVVVQNLLKRVEELERK